MDDLISRQAAMDAFPYVNMNKCEACAYYQPRTFYCEYYLKGKETAVFLCPHCGARMDGEKNG